MTKTYIGIDPGNSGAIAAFIGDTIQWIGNDSTEHELSSWLADVTADADAVAMLEQVHSMPGQGVKSTFTFGQSFGFLRGLLIAHRVPFEMVTPTKWQTALRCRTGGKKAISRAKAQELFPSQRWTNKNADAVLLAEYCRRNWGK